MKKILKNTAVCAIFHSKKCVFLKSGHFIITEDMQYFRENDHFRGFSNIKLFITRKRSILQKNDKRQKSFKMIQKTL